MKHIVDGDLIFSIGQEAVLTVRCIQKSIHTIPIAHGILQSNQEKEFNFKLVTFKLKVLQ